MDNCDLEELSISGGKLQPAFTPLVRDYRVTVESNVNKVRLDLVTSDCGASCRILFGDGSSSINLDDGLNRVEVEVIAEDGTKKKYCVEITKLSAKAAELIGLALEGDVPLDPAFSTQIHQYYCTVPFHCSAVTPLPTVPDKSMKVSVNGGDASKPVPLHFGDTVVQISVCSADGSNSLLYSVLVTRDLMPMNVTFTDRANNLDYECPVSLNAFYRPIFINHSEPKHIFSRPYIEMLARRSKIDPLSQCPLGESWRVTELDLDGKMSAALVKCFFAYRGAA